MTRKCYECKYRTIIQFLQVMKDSLADFPELHPLIDCWIGMVKDALKDHIEKVPAEVIDDVEYRMPVNITNNQQGVDE